MKKLVMLVMMMGLMACSAGAAKDSKFVELTPAEKARLAVIHKAQEALDIEQAMIGVKAQQLNVDRQKLRQDIIDAHKLEYNQNYTLDEVGGRLVKQ